MMLILQKEKTDMEINSILLMNSEGGKKNPNFNFHFKSEFKGDFKIEIKYAAFRLC